MPYELVVQMGAEQFDSAGFRALVGSLECLMSSPTVSRDQLEYELLSLLARLFEQGVTLACLGGYVSAQPSLGRDWSDEFECTNPGYLAWLERWRASGCFGPERFGDHDYVDLPMEPSNPRYPDASSLAGSLSRALSQLMVGACMYDQGHHGEATRDWLAGFGCWGNHVNRSLRVIYLRFPWDYEWDSQFAECDAEAGAQ